MNWPFDDPPNLAVITTKAIAARQQPVLLVTHDDDDGTWQFLPLEGELRVLDAAVVGLRSMIERDGTLAQLANLPRGWRAWRESPNDPWPASESQTRVLSNRDRWINPDNSRRAFGSVNTRPAQTLLSDAARHGSPVDV